jgi:hypothetical protein
MLGTAFPTKLRQEKEKEPVLDLCMIVDFLLSGKMLIVSFYFDFKVADSVPGGECCVAVRMYFAIFLVWRQH